MQWKDSAIIIKKYDHSDHLSIVSCFTIKYGLRKGIVKLGNKKQQQACIGNVVEIIWKGRLEEHLGRFDIQAQEFVYPFIYNDHKKLVSLQSILELLSVCLVEKEPQQELYEHLENFIYKLKFGESNWLLSMVFLEMHILAKLGFGFDCSKCAVTGSAENLAYLSPKTGRAVSERIGKPYAEKLFVLPKIFIDADYSPTSEEVTQAFKITKYFFEKNLFKLKGINLPDIRNILQQIL